VSEPERGKWTAAGQERGCYCGLWDKDPAMYEEKGYPLGYCGFCERCGVPGHTRHHPGPVPYTGTWCDRCYGIVRWIWPFQSAAGWIAVVIGLGFAWAVAPAIIAVVNRAMG
jgi:hypothetical protein